MADLGYRVGRGHIGNGVVVVRVTYEASNDCVGADILDNGGVTHVADGNTLGECADDGGDNLSAGVGEVGIHKGNAGHIIGRLGDGVCSSHIGDILVVGITRKCRHNRIRTRVFDDTGGLVTDADAIGERADDGGGILRAVIRVCNVGKAYA